MRVIGLEVSTSAAKGVVFSRTGWVEASAQEPFDRNTSDTLTQDPRGVYRAVIRVLKSLADRCPDVAAIGLGGTWHSLLPLDKDRQPLGRIRLWAEVSAGPTVNRVRSEKSAVLEFYHRTGCVVHAMYPMWKWVHLKQNEPGLATGVRHLSSQVEFVFEKLTERHWVSNTIASGTGFWNMHTREWDEDILAVAGIQAEQLGELHEMNEWAPLSAEAAHQTGLPAGLPVTVGGADGALNQIGVGGAGPGVMTLSVGTSGAVRVPVESPPRLSEPSVWCYYLHRGKRLLGGATHAGSNLDWVRDRLGKIDDSGPGGATVGISMESPYFLPFIFGERCPGWREDRPGGFLGLRGHHGRGDLNFAAMEGILFNLYQCYEALIAASPRPDQILVSGGILHAPDWLQMAADVFGRDLITTGYSNDSTVGAAIVALEAAGEIGSVSECRPVITDVVQPRPGRVETHRQRFTNYLRLYHLNETATGAADGGFGLAAIGCEK